MFFLFSIAFQCPPPPVLLLFCNRNYRSFALTLGLGSMLFKEVDKHLKSLACSNGEIDVTPVILCKFHCFDILCITACNPDCTDWDFGCSTARTSSACCSNCEVNTKSLYRSLHHGLCHFLTYSSLLFKKLMVNTKQIFLHLVGVRYYSTLKIG